MDRKRAQSIDKTLGAPVSKEGIPTLHLNLNSGAPLMSSQDFSPKGQVPACFLEQLPDKSSAAVINSGNVLMNPQGDFF